MSNAPHFGSHPMFQGFGRPVRQEVDLRDCEVEGQLPTDLEGSFYRIGPDYQYPPHLPNIPFDGEGHLCLFRFSGGRVDFRSRYVHTERYMAQAAAGRALYGTYRNPFTDEPAVAGLSRGTANTNVFHHHGKLMVLKEDSPPVVMNPHTLETLDPVYRFGGQLTAETFTAHPKLDSETGEMLGIAYEAKGLGSCDVACYSFNAQGQKTWEAWVKVPYAGMLHDFAVTRSYIAFLVVPMVTDIERMRAGHVHFAWDSTLPTWLGVLRRGGDGSDIRWFKGPERCATHVMGAFENGTRLSIDMDMGLKNQFPFFPQRDDSPFDPVAAQGHVVRLSVDLADKLRPGYDMETLYPHSGVLSRQDDRFHSVAYDVGFMPTLDMTAPFDARLAAALPFRPLNHWTRFDHSRRAATSWFVGPDSGVQEACFVPRNASAAEGEGYLIGVVNRFLEMRNDLVVLDAQRLNEGPIATVRMPTRLPAQVHGWWVPGTVVPATRL